MTTQFITSQEDWLQEFKKDRYKIWIRVILSNGSSIYLPDHDHWLKLKDYCKDNHFSINTIGLQYRSHSIEVNTSDCEGVYLSKSVLGTFGQDTKQTYTIGKLYDGIVKKTIWILPELIQEIELDDKVEDCFEQALIHNYAQER
jgi:hypothetical protein